MSGCWVSQQPHYPKVGTVLGFLASLFRDCQESWCEIITIYFASRRTLLSRTETSAEQREPFLRMGNPPLLHLPLLLPSSSSRPLTSWCTINLNLPTLLTHFLSASLLRPDGDEDADLPDSDDDDGDVPLPTTSSASQRILQTRFNQVPAGTYSYVSYVKVYATCRLRRIWFSEDGPKQRLPWEFQLYAAD